MSSSLSSRKLTALHRITMVLISKDCSSTFWITSFLLYWSSTISSSNLSLQLFGWVANSGRIGAWNWRVGGVQVTKGKQRKDFFTIPEYEQWLEQTPDAHKWDSKYYKVRDILTAYLQSKLMFAKGSRNKQRLWCERLFQSYGETHDFVCKNSRRR